MAELNELQDLDQDTIKKLLEFVAEQELDNDDDDLVRKSESTFGSLEPEELRQVNSGYRVRLTHSQLLMLISCLQRAERRLASLNKLKHGNIGCTIHVDPEHGPTGRLKVWQTKFKK